MSTQLLQRHAANPSLSPQAGFSSQRCCYSATEGPLRRHVTSTPRLENSVFSKEGAQKSARNLSFHWPFAAARPGRSGAPQERARKSPRAISPSTGPFWPPVPGERRSSKEGVQKSARNLSFHWPFAAASPGRSGAPQRRARKSPRAASSFHWPFPATSPGGTALLKGGRAKVRARPFLPLALPGRQSREKGLLKGGRAKVRAQPLPSVGPSWSPIPANRRSSKKGAQKSARSLFFPLALLPSIGPFWPPVPGERRSSKEGAQKSTRSLFCPLALPAPGNGAPQRRARKSPRATFPSVGSSWSPVPGERRSSKEGAQKSARNLSFHWPLPGRPSLGNSAPQRRARKSPRAASSFHWPFLATSPGGTALLKGGRAKVRAQPLLSIGPSSLPVPRETSPQSGGAQKSARDLSFHWPFLAASSGGSGAPQRRAHKSPRAASSFHGPFLVTSPGGTALLKGGRAKVRAQPLLSIGPSCTGERRSSKEGAQKSAFLPLALPGRPCLGNGAPQRRARKSPRAASSIHCPFLATSPGGTALLKGGRAKVRAQPLPSMGPSWSPVSGERRSSKEGAQKSARSVFFPLALSGHQPRRNGAPQRRARKSPRANFPSIDPFWPPAPQERRSLKEGARKSARSLFFPLALPGRQSRENDAPQRRARKSPRAASSFHGPFLVTSLGGTALLKGGRAKVRARPLSFHWPFLATNPGRSGAPQRRARKSPRAASSFHWPFLAASPGGTALLKGGRAKVRAQPLLSIGPFWPPASGERRSSKEGAQKSARSLFFPLALSGRQSRGNGAPPRRARKSPRAASSFHWPFLAASPRGTALLKGGRAKVRAQSFLPLALSGRQSRGNGAPQRRARKSPRAIFPSIGPSRPPVPGEAALLKGGRAKGGRAKVRAQPLLSIGPFRPPVPGERRSSKGGAQKSARDLSFHWPFLAASPGGTALLKGGRAKVRSRPLLSIDPSWPPVPGERRSSKEGAQKSARSLFLP